jgi:CBS domain-containing protein
VGNELKVGEVMTPNPLAVKEGDLATKARALFRRTGYKGIPVVNDSEVVTGMISLGDMLRITSTRSNLTAEGIMGPVLVYLTPEEWLLNAVRKMLRARVDRAVVVESELTMKLIGLLSEHDAIEAFQDVDAARDVRVRDFMTEDVVTCTPKEPVIKVWNKMMEGAFWGIPVVNKKVIGMVTGGDILAAGYARIRRENEKDLSKRTPAVEKIMRTPAITVHPEATLKDAMDLMVSSSIGRLPVVKRGKLRGIIDREDVLNKILEVLD